MSSRTQEKEWIERNLDEAFINPESWDFKGTILDVHKIDFPMTISPNGLQGFSLLFFPTYMKSLYPAKSFDN